MGMIPSSPNDNVEEQGDEDERRLSNEAVVMIFQTKDQG